MKEKNCKVVSTYFGVRHNYPYNGNDTINMLKDFIKNEKNLDPGVDNLDVIFINHDCGETQGKEFLNTMNGTSIYCGKIRVFHREWNSGAGISLGSFNYAFEKLKNEYDYWFFIEDDYKVVKKDYYIKGIEILNKNKDVAFVGYDMVDLKERFQEGNTKATTSLDVKILKIFMKPLILLWGYGKYLDQHNEILKKCEKLIHQQKLFHAEGMLGLTHRKFLNLIVEKNGELPHHNIPNPRKQLEFKKLTKITYSPKGFILKFILYNKYFVWYWLHAVLGEIEFTRIYYDLGFRIEPYPDDKKLIYSYKEGRLKHE